MLRIAPALFFSQCDLRLLLLDFSAQSSKKAHVHVGHRHQREACDQITSPIVEQQPVTRDVEEGRGDVMAEAILT